MSPGGWDAESGMLHGRVPVIEEARLAIPCPPAFSPAPNLNASAPRFGGHQEIMV
ncbi:MAG TPA: hypothetical protein VJZ49_02100 [Syntrophales bacterium]|nr:hypothetical protein [Syntrophales bacterium]